MAPKENRILSELEDVTLTSVSCLREYLNYGGQNREYLQRAKISAAILTGYTRLFASLTNRQMVELAIEKHLERNTLPSAK